MTQQNTANAEETASSAEQLNAQAALLRRALSRFKLMKTDAAREALPEADPGRRLIGPSAGAGEWPEKEPGEKKRVLKPDDVISLDGDDFGKY